MDELPFQQLSENGALLLALVLLFDVVAPTSRIGRLSLRQASLGVIIGAIGLGVMLTPWRFAPGIVFDTRSVLLSISGLFFGAAPTLVAMALTAAYRLYQGGGGALTGVSVILATGSLGIAWRHLRRRPLAQFPVWEIYLFGIVTHLVMLALMFTLPWATALRVLAAIAVPVLVVYPLATALLGALMVNRLRRVETQAELERLLGEARETQETLRRLAEERQRAADTLARRNDLLAALQETMLELVSRLDLDALLQNIVKRAARLMGASAGFLDLVNDETGQLEPRVGLGVLREALQHPAQPGESVAEIVWRTGRPLVVNDYDAWPGRIEDFSRQTLGAVVAAPLQSAGKTLGVLGLGREFGTPQTFDQDAIEILVEFGRLAAIAIENARLFTATERSRHALLSVIEDQKTAQEALRESHRLLQRRADELTTIYNAARRLQQLYSPDALAQELIHLLEDTLHYEFGSVLLIDEATNELKPFAVSDQGQGLAFIQADKAYIASHHIAVGQGITGYVAQTGQTVRAGDVRLDKRYYAVREGILSELCVPLRVGDRIIGVLNVKAAQLDAYTESDQRVLETIASQVALAIQQAQLHEQVQRYAAEQEQRVQERTIQLQAANRELEAFAYSISHDLRAPLRALDGFSAALLARYADQLDEQGRHWLDRIQKASQRMGQLIGDLLNLSRVTRAEFNRQPVDLAELAREIAADLQSRDPQRQIEFDITETLPAQGDPRLLRIALQNLLENAWKFTGPCDRPRIEVGQAPGNALSQPPDAHPTPDSGPPASPIFFVRDNGVGFDMAYADKLFAPFQRLHSESEFAGTGIGLVTVQRIVMRHGGRIWPKARVNGGATFYFTLASD